MARRFLFALALTVFLPAHALAFAATGDYWKDGDANLFIGNLDQFWREVFRDAAKSWNRNTSFEFDIHGHGHSACETILVNEITGEEGIELRNGARFDTDACGGGSLGDNVLAVAEWLPDEDGHIQSAGITFNENFDWSVYGGPVKPDTIDFRRVAIHELGHMLGLGHEDGIPTVMSSVINDVDGLTQDDVDGAESIYGNYVEPPPPSSLDPVDQCHIDQIVAGGKYCKKYLKCEGNYAKNPAADPGALKRDSCVNGARTAFQNQWQDAIDKASDNGATCNNEDPGSDVSPLIDAAAAQAAVDVGVGASATDANLRSKLTKKIGGFCKRDLDAYKKEVTGSNLVLALAKARAKITDCSDKRITKFAAKGAVYDGAPIDQIATDIEALAAAVAGAAAGAP